MRRSKYTHSVASLGFTGPDALRLAAWVAARAAAPEGTTVASCDVASGGCGYPTSHCICAKPAVDVVPADVAAPALVPANDRAADDVAWAASTKKPDDCGGFESDEPPTVEDCLADAPAGAEPQPCGECLACVAQAFATAEHFEEPNALVAMARAEAHQYADDRAAEAEAYDLSLAGEVV